MRQRDDAAGGGATASATETGQLVGQLDAIVSRIVAIDADTLSSGELRRTVAAVTRQVGRLEGVRATMVASAERTGAAAAAGAPSAAAWLADATGGTTAVAARTATLGRAMDRSPDLADAVADGRIGSEHAASIARAADRGVLADDQLDHLVDDARALPAGAFARAVRSAEARTEQRQLRRDEGLARERRFADWWTNDDGSVEGRFRLDPVGGQPVVTALEALTAPDPAETPDEARRTARQRRADAMTQLGRLTLERGDTPIVRTVKPHVTVTVPVSMLARSDGDAEAAGAVGTLPDGTVISAASARRLLCDAAVRRLVLDPDGEPLDVGRATRVWSGSQRAALAAIDGGCRGPACDRPFAWTDIHHIRWWRHRGRTALDNGIPLCGHCHDLVHHSGWTVVLDAATREATWTSPSGVVTASQPRGPAASSRHRR